MYLLPTALLVGGTSSLRYWLQQRVFEPDQAIDVLPTRNTWYEVELFGHADVLPWSLIWHVFFEALDSCCQSTMWHRLVSFAPNCEPRLQGQEFYVHVRVLSLNLPMSVEPST